MHFEDAHTIVTETGLRLEAEKFIICTGGGEQEAAHPRLRTHTDGSLDYDEELLAGFDFVVASVHSGFTMSREDMEARIIRAMDNPYTTILGHPTGRLLLARDGYQVDMGRIIEAAAVHHVVIELNASPYRFDIDWRYQKAGQSEGAS